MDWPPQNTGTFAAPICAFCVVAVVDKVEFKYIGQGYNYVGLPRLDGDDGLSYYMTHTLGGSINSSVYTDGDCADLLGTDTYTYAGSCTYNPYLYIWEGDTTVNGSTNGCGNPTSYILPAGPDSNHYTDSTNATVSTLTGNNQCIPSGDGYVYNVDGTVTVTLSNQWTETLGITVSESTGWTEWEVQGMFPDPVESQGSIWEAWAGAKQGIGYDYHQAQFRRTKNGFNPNQTYTGSIEIYRRPYPSGVWSLYATMTELLTADSVGNVVMEATIPLARGYATWPKATSFTVT